MRFGEIPVGEAAGAILAHSLRFGATALRKAGCCAPADVEALIAAGVSHIVAARLDPGDLREDEAADRVAAVVAGANVTASPAFTGRANLFAEARGLLVFDRDRLDRLNLVDEAVTLGTLPPFAIVEPRQMVATVKIIPFAVPEAAVARAAAFAAEGGPLLRVAAFAPLPGRADPDAAAGAEGKHPRQDPRRHRDAAGGARLGARFRGALRAHGRRAGACASPPPSRPAPISCWCTAPRSSSTGAT